MIFISYYNPFTKEEIGRIGFERRSVDFIKHEYGTEFSQIYICGEVFNVKQNFHKLVKTIFK